MCLDTSVRSNRSCGFANMTFTVHFTVVYAKRWEKATGSFSGLCSVMTLHF